MPTLADVVAALAAAGVTLDSAPEAAPARPVAASPFAGATLVRADGPAKVDTTPEPLRGLSRIDRKATAAGLAIAGWSCDVDAEYVLTDGSRVTGALHGYSIPHKSGEPCNGVANLPRGEACTGKVR